MRMAFKIPKSRFGQELGVFKVVCQNQLHVRRKLTFVANDKQPLPKIVAHGPGISLKLIEPS